MIWLITAILVWLAIQRIMSGDYEIDGTIMAITAAVGVLVNIMYVTQLLLCILGSSLHLSFLFVLFVPNLHQITHVYELLWLQKVLYLYLMVIKCHRFIQCECWAIVFRMGLILHYGGHTHSHGGSSAAHGHSHGAHVTLLLIPIKNLITSFIFSLLYYYHVNFIQPTLFCWNRRNRTANQRVRCRTPVTQPLRSTKPDSTSTSEQPSSTWSGICARVSGYSLLLYLFSSR